jgi:tRNA G18 (ribose-2'-O)-methylase SpoU
MGSALRVPYTRIVPWPGALATLIDDGFQIVALTPSPDATPLARYANTVAPDARLILMLGAEGEGLSPAAFDMAGARVRIPIADDVDSLNVVVAAGIALAALSS